MKDLIESLILTACLLVFLVGCKEPSTKQPAEHPTQKRIEAGMISTQEFQGHTYIILEGFQESSLTHDPDCTCKENK